MLFGAAVAAVVVLLLVAVVAEAQRPRPPPPSLRTTACAACVLVVQELEGISAEPLAEAAAEKYLRTELCPKLGSTVGFVCDLVASNLPEIVRFIGDEVHPAETCKRVRICDAVPNPLEADGLPLPPFTVNLDAAPEDRWGAIVNRTEFWAPLVRIQDSMEALLSDEVSKLFFDLGEEALSVSPQPFRGEIEGIATATGIPRGFLFLLNIFFELTNACTSMVVQNPGDPNATPIFSRSQDLGYGMGFTNMLRNQTALITFTKGGKTVGQGVTFMGYVGLPTASVPGKFAMSLDSRAVNVGLLGYIEGTLREIIDKQANPATWVVRAGLEAGDDYAAAVRRWQTTEIVSNVYAIIAGTRHNEGTVIARNQTAVRFTQVLGHNTVKGGAPWFVLQTNYDPDRPAPWYDDRRPYAQKALKDYCKNGTAVTDRCMYEALSVHPVLNLLSLYTAQVSPANPAVPLDGFRRTCHDLPGSPCSL